VITHVEPRVRQDGPDVFWRPGIGGSSVLRINVILTTPLTQPPAVVGVVLLHDAEPRDSHQGTVRDVGPLHGTGITAPADVVDRNTGNAMASIKVELSSRLGWCRGSQCVLASPTVLRPVHEPRLATGDVAAIRWHRIASRRQPWETPEPDEPKALEGTQEVEAGRVPLTATLDSTTPAATPTDNDSILWRSNGELNEPVAKITDNDLALAQQNAIFLAGVEVGVATALVPWGFQLLFELAAARRRRR
jgi:hypothetical protein